MINKLWAIARTTFVETIRQPIYGVLTWSAVGLLVLNPNIAAFSLESGGDNKIMKDVGLSTLMLYGLLLAVFSATGVITREIESFTVLTVVSKPVSRPEFLIGKFLGVAVAVLVGFYFLSLVFAMTVQHGVMETTADKYDQPVLTLSILVLAISLAVAGFGNFAYGWHFATTLLAWVVPLGTVALVVTLMLDRAWKPVILMDDIAPLEQVAYALAAVFLAVLVLTALAVALSTRFSQVATLTLCFVVLLLGLCSDYFFGLRTAEGLPYQLMATVLPNFQVFWLGDAITQEQPIHPLHIGKIAAYAGIYTAALLGLGVALFQTREVG